MHKNKCSLWQIARGQKEEKNVVLLILLCIVVQLYYDIPHLVQRKDLQVAYAQK